MLYPKSPADTEHHYPRSALERHKRLSHSSDIGASRQFQPDLCDFCSPGCEYPRADTIVCDDIDDEDTRSITQDTETEMRDTP